MTRRSPEPRAVHGQPFAIGVGPDASEPSGRMAFIHELMPVVADYVRGIARDGLNLSDWVILLIDPRRRDIGRELEQRPGARVIVAQVMMELADNRPAACMFAIPRTDFLGWLRTAASHQRAINIDEQPLAPGEIYFAALFKDYITHGRVKLGHGSGVPRADEGARGRRLS